MLLFGMDKKKSVMNGLFGDFIPLEIWDLILDKLENDSDEIFHSMVSCIYLFTALENSVIPRSYQRQFKNRWQFLNCTKQESWTEVLRVSPTVKVLASDSNLLEERKGVRDDLRSVFVVDECTEPEKINSIGCKNLELIYCGDPLAIGDFIVRLSSHCQDSTISLTVDSDRVALSGKNLFGILNADLFAWRWTFDKVRVSFPWARILECNYMALDTFIYQALSGRETSRNGSQLFDRFLQEFRMDFPMLEQIKFVKQIKTRDETCNFIDLSSLMLSKFKDRKIPLMNLFRIHSFENWNLSRISEFSGHRFKFDETTMTGSPERRTISLRENLSLLREMATKETIDATPYYRLNLLPKGVKHTRIANWIPLQSTPIMILKSKSLESLSLRLLTFENAPATVVQGLFLPTLQFLNLEQIEEQQSTPAPPTDRRSSTELSRRPAIADIEPCTGSMDHIVFSSWNQLTNLHIIQSDMTSNHYVFDIQNLKSSLPSINLSKSFQTFFDEQQRFIVV